MLTQKSPKIPKKFWCHHCDYSTLSKKDFNKHLLTAKHKMLTHADKDADTKIPKNKLNDFTCECGRVYKQRQSLHRHRKKCKYVENKEKETNESELSNENEINNVDDVKKMFYEVVANQQKQMAQLTEVITDSTKQMVESQKQMVEAKNTITNNTINNNNFNLNLFLNDTCKDALNLTDFLNSIKVQLKDLEYTAEHGHIEGITKIFKNALTNMEVTQRPMHCTDLKREILYIKDNNKWDKDIKNDKIKKAITQVVDKNIGNTSQWLEKYPNHTDVSSEENNMYIKMIENSYGKGDEKETNKVLKGIMKEVIIEKDK
tara:strand:- start:304 stop:1254 length:951 start_codon:yes stop_codon:yes gene_type:complete